MTSQSQSQEPENAEKELSAEEKLVAHEAFLSEIYNGYQMAGQAINRLECFTFAMVRSSAQLS